MRIRTAIAYNKMKLDLFSHFTKRKMIILGKFPTIKTEKKELALLNRLIKETEI